MSSAYDAQVLFVLSVSCRVKSPPIFLPPLPPPASVMEELSEASITNAEDLSFLACHSLPITCFLVVVLVLVESIQH